MKNKCLFCLTPLLFSSVGAVAAITGISIANENTPNKIKIIDYKYLDISNDHKTLYGFKKDINVQELIDQQYNTLVIPNNVERIEDYAFCSIFDQLNINIINIYLSEAKHLKYIGHYAFFHCFSVQYVDFDKLPTDAQLETIGDHSFDSCNLTCDITLPKNLVEIGDGAFYKGIVGSNKIVFPEKLNYVGSQAFARCPEINELDFTSYSQMPEWLMKANSLFNNSASDISYVNLFAHTEIDSEIDWRENISTKQGLAPETSIMLKETKRTVPNDAFETELRSEEVHGEIVWHLWLVGFNYEKYIDDLNDCDQLIIPEGIEYIEHDVFNTDETLKTPHAELILPSTLIGIGDNAFRSCQWLCGNLSIPSTVTSIGKDAFHECHFSGLLNLTSESQYRLELEVGEAAFAKNDFAAVAIDSNVIFHKDCFKENYKLHIIDLSILKPEDVPNEERYDSLFPDQECGTIIWPTEGKPEKYDKWQEYFTNIGLYDRIHDGRWAEICKPLDEPTDETSFITGDNYEKVYGLSEGGKRANETSIIFHTNTREIKAGAFSGEFELIDDDPKSMKTLQFNKGLEIIGNNAFSDCSGIVNTELEFPRTIKEIREHAFNRDSNLMADLKLPSQIKRIESGAFNYCPQVISNCLEIPSSTEYIGSFAFSYFKFVNTIKFDPIGTTLTIGDKAFTSFSYLNVVDFSSWGDTPPRDKLILPLSDWSFDLDDAKLGKVSTTQENKIIYLSPNANVSEWKSFLELDLGFGISTQTENPWTVVKKGEDTERSNYA